MVSTRQLGRYPEEEGEKLKYLWRMRERERENIQMADF
jgi:hypothetical protein